MGGNPFVKIRPLFTGDVPVPPLRALTLLTESCQFQGVMLEKYFPGREFKALLFDFDGTVADTMDAHFSSWNKALAVFGLTISRDQHLSWAGRTTRQILKLIGEIHGLEIDPDAFIKNKEVHYFALLDAVVPVTPVVEIIEHFQGKLPMAIVSGSRRKMVEAALNHLALRSYFDVLVCAEDYVQGKPHPEGFLKAAQLLGAAPADCLAFEDAALGIEAARNAGISCLVVEGPEWRLKR
jgi:HAD superfamily hydrolase (TIGR01509 family)